MPSSRNKAHTLTRRDFFLQTGALAAACALTKSANAAARPPNVVVLLADDMGWRDAGCYGSTFYETPNIDRLAREGVRFTSAYAAAALCSPTRASLLTGKYPARMGLTNYIGGRQEPTPYESNLAHDEVTLADSMRDNGYATGYIGKWHLCKQGDEDTHGPTSHGFDWSVGEGGSMPFYFPPHLNFHSQGEPATINLPDPAEGQHLGDRLTDEALGFIEQNRDNPFLLYFAFYDPHTPIEAKEELVEKYEQKARALGIDKPKAPLFLPEPVGITTTRQIQNHPVYAAMMETLDTNVGRVLDKLAEAGIADNTIVVFLSDNGGLSCYDARPTSNTPLRAGKAWLGDGGLRIPLIVRWPGLESQGSTCGDPVITADLYPTILEMAGLEQRPEQHVDGLSLLPLLRGTGRLQRDSLYWHWPHVYPCPETCGAVRQGDHKLVEYFRDGRCELYDLRNDPGETRDIAQEMPEKRDALLRALREWREKVGARMPAWPPE